MIVLRTPKGWTGPEGGRRPAGRGLLPLPPGAARRPADASPSTSRQLEQWMRSYRARGAVRRARRAARGARRAGAARASGAWAPTRTPTAACCCATSSCPTSASYAVEVARPGAGDERGHARARRLPARRDPNANRENFRIIGPDETASNRLERGVRGDRPHLGGRSAWRPTITSRPTGASWRCSASTSARAGSRATC